MASSQPITFQDLNGISLNPTDLATDELIGYVGYIKNVCTDLGTKNDSIEGFNDWVNFKNEIDSARISTFTPDSIDDNHTFDTLDLTGDNIDIPAIPITWFAMYNNMMLMSYAMNGGMGVTPFDIAGNAVPKTDFVAPDSVGFTPFDLDGGIPVKSNSGDEVVLTA